MGSTSINYSAKEEEKEEEAKAKIEIWKYIFGFTEMAVVKCVVELGIPDVLEAHQAPMTLEKLSSLLGCHLSPLHRIMRFLTYRGIFKEDNKGVRTLVDVGGGDGTALAVLVKVFPWIHGINFDLPHVVSTAKPCAGVVSIAGDMFKSIPKGDAIFMKWIMHDWGDDECINILKNCTESIPKDTGKVIIVDAVIELYEEEKCKKLAGAGLLFDMVMMAHTAKGKERTPKEWTCILKPAGFNQIIFKNIEAVQSVIVAYP